MSMENAREFLKKIGKDEALKERLTGKEPEEVLPAAKELGLECTQEELETAAKSRELSPDEMAGAAGGSFVKNHWNNPKLCSNPAGHQWVYLRHEEEEQKLLWFEWSYGYNYYECAHCHWVIRKET